MIYPLPFVNIRDFILNTGRIQINVFLVAKGKMENLKPSFSGEFIYQYKHTTTTNNMTLVFKMEDTAIEKFLLHCHNVLFSDFGFQLDIINIFIMT